jgi:hypothetical protein
MATVCGALSSDMVRDCDNKPIAGVETTIGLINIDDWNNATITKDATNSNIITGITLPTGKKAYKLQVFKRTHKPKFEFQDGDNGVYYKHSIGTNIPLWTQAVKDQVQALAEGYVVAIVENVNKSTGSPIFEIYGAKNGLRMPDGVRDLSTNDGLLTGTFTNDDGMNEPMPPATFLATGGTYTATKNAFNNLFVAAS